MKFKNLNLQNLQSNPNFILILKILSIILLFFIFIIFPINRLQRSKTIFLESQNKLKEITKQEQIFKNKLNTLKKKIKEEEETVKQYREDFISKSFSSSTEIKLHIKNKMEEFNLNLSNIYRIEKEEISEELNFESYIYKIGIPYEVSGSFDDYYKFLFYFYNFEKYLLFNQHNLSIDFYDFNKVNIKFYATALTFSDPE
ncbi:MAG: hypothetical protein KA336_02770 [Fusobacteriaceae bacterium]|nr:hypothetical protein [Fusobacteriaceae bacterium]